MKYQDWKLIGNITTVLGVIFLLAAGFAQFYSVVNEYWYPYNPSRPHSFETIYPYQQYAAYPLIPGVILLVIGLGFDWRANAEPNESIPVQPSLNLPPFDYCPKCGKPVRNDQFFCDNCGKKLNSLSSEKGTLET